MGKIYEESPRPKTKTLPGLPKSGTPNPFCCSSAFYRYSVQVVRVGGKTSVTIADIAFVGLQTIILFCAVYAAFQPASALHRSLVIGTELGRIQGIFDASVLAEMLELYRVNYPEFLRRYRQAVFLMRIYGISFILASIVMIWFVVR